MTKIYDIRFEQGQGGNVDREQDKKRTGQHGGMDQGDSEQTY